MNKQNIKQHLLGSFFALAIAGALLTLPSADASTPTLAQGSFTDCQTLTQTNDSNPDYTIYTWDITITFAGTFTGTWVGTEEDVVYNSGGYFTVHGIGTFTGSVSGRSGTVNMTYLAAGSPPGRIISPWVVDAGTDGLAGLAGQGTWPQVIETGPTETCDTTFRAKYVGQIQFAP